MRITNNSQCCHEFFYCNVDTVNQDYTFGTQCSFGKSFSDEQRNILNFYSYYTKVAMLYEGLNENVLLIHWGSMSPTTGKHLSHLKSANPYYTTISVPFIYGEHTTSLRQIVNELIKHIQSFNNDKECLYKKPNRNFYDEVKKAFKDIEYYIGLDDDDMQYMDMLNNIDDFLNNDTFIQKKKELAAKKAAETRQANKIRKEKIAALKADINSKYELYDLIKATFYYNLFDYEQKQFIKNNILTPDKSFVWVNDDNTTISTSKNITVNVAEVITLLKLWKHNKLKHGMQLDRYTVLEVMPDYVKIGCHKIPVENIQALYNELITQKAAA